MNTHPWFTTLGILLVLLSAPIALGVRGVIAFYFPLTYLFFQTRPVKIERDSSGIWRVRFDTHQFTESPSLRVALAQALQKKDRPPRKPPQPEPATTATNTAHSPQ